MTVWNPVTFILMTILIVGFSSLFISLNYSRKLKKKNQLLESILKESLDKIQQLKQADSKISAETPKTENLSFDLGSMELEGDSENEMNLAEFSNNTHPIETPTENLQKILSERLVETREQLRFLQSAEGQIEENLAWKELICKIRYENLDTERQISTSITDWNQINNRYQSIFNQIESYLADTKPSSSHSKNQAYETLATDFNRLKKLIQKQANPTNSLFNQLTVLIQKPNTDPQQLQDKLAIFYDLYLEIFNEITRESKSAQQDSVKKIDENKELSLDIETLIEAEIQKIALPEHTDFQQLEDEILDQHGIINKKQPKIQESTEPHHNFSQKNYDIISDKTENLSSTEDTGFSGFMSGIKDKTRSMMLQTDDKTSTPLYSPQQRPTFNKQEEDTYSPSLNPIHQKLETDSRLLGELKNTINTLEFELKDFEASKQIIQNLKNQQNSLLDLQIALRNAEDKESQQQYLMQEYEAKIKKLERSLQKAESEKVDLKTNKNHQISDFWKNENSASLSHKSDDFSEFEDILNSQDSFQSVNNTQASPTTSISSNMPDPDEFDMDDELTQLLEEISSVEQQIKRNKKPH
jgi:hypothetical protein